MESIATLNVEHLVGTEVGTSTILRELARGGMAIVFIAYQRTLKRQIAVKILPKSLITEKAADLFQQEAESAAILSHPNIIQIYEVGETDEFLFFTMQLVIGKALSRMLEMAKRNIIPSRRVLPLTHTIDIISQILDALAYSHDQEIVHRDIKPGNILVEKHSKRPIISDFGIAKVLSNENESRPAIQGTPLYMAPEQVLGKELDGRADIYAVGTILFQMLVSELPLRKFKSKKDLLKNKALNKNGIFNKNPTEINPQLNPDMDLIVQKAMAHDPEQRYLTCREFIEDLALYKKNHLQ